MRPIENRSPVGSRFTTDQCHKGIQEAADYSCHAQNGMIADSSAILKIFVRTRPCVKVSNYLSGPSGFSDCENKDESQNYTEETQDVERAV